MMDTETLGKVQQRVDLIRTPWIEKLHKFNVPADFKPWAASISPSALYNCSLTCRKAMKIKTPEVKWVSIKRWVSVTPEGVTLPDGVFLSIKRREEYSVYPKPHFDKKVFTLLMFPYGNVWSMIAPDEPITESWLWSDNNGKIMLESLMMKDAAHPIKGYFESCKKYMEENPEQIGIHLKRKKQLGNNPDPRESRSDPHVLLNLLTGPLGGLFIETDLHHNRLALFFSDREVFDVAYSLLSNVEDKSVL